MYSKQPKVATFRMVREGVDLSHAHCDRKECIIFTAFFNGEASPPVATSSSSKNQPWRTFVVLLLSVSTATNYNVDCSTSHIVNYM